LCDAHRLEKGEIGATFKRVIAFLRVIDRVCARPVTREDVFKA
jgi:hypothetical protein